MVKVDATVEQSLAGKYGIKGYPTIKVFKPAASAPEDYNGARSAASMSEFLIATLPNNVVSLTSATASKFWSQAPTSALRVVLFTSKTATSPLFKAKAMEYAKRAVFGEVRQSAKDLCEKYGVSTFPTLMLLTAEDSDPVKFEGPIKAETVSAWLKENLDSSSSSGAKSESQPQSAEKRVKVATIPRREFSALPDSGSLADCDGTICIVAVTAFGEGGSVLEEISKKYSKQPLFGFRTATIGASATKALESTLKESFSSAKILAVNTKRNKFVTAEEFSASSVSKLLDRIAGGDAPWKKF